MGSTSATALHQFSPPENFDQPYHLPPLNVRVNVADADLSPKRGVRDSCL